PANLTITATNPVASNITMTNQEPTGNDWDIGATTPGGNTNWSDLNPATYSAAQGPGNTYELLPGARLRTPDGPVTTAFPGRQLTVDANGVFSNAPTLGAPTAEIRFKQYTFGTNNNMVNGVVNFPKLRMNGGQLDTGNDGLLIIGGEIDILANTAIYN